MRDVAYHLAHGPYRYRDEQWELCDDGAWEVSRALEGYSYNDGVTVVADCPWASLREEDAAYDDESGYSAFRAARLDRTGEA